MDYTIKNCVVVVQLNRGFDLDEVAQVIPKAKYDPWRFTAVFFKLPSGVRAILAESGKVTLNGIKTANYQKYVNELMELIKRYYNNVEVVDVRIAQIVAYFDLHRTIVLEDLWQKFDNVVYEPETFPAATLRLPELGVTLNIFSTGKICCYRAKSIEQLKEVGRWIEENLSK